MFRATVNTATVLLLLFLGRLGFRAFFLLLQVFSAIPNFFLNQRYVVELNNSIGGELRQLGKREKRRKLVFTIVTLFEEVLKF